MKLINSSLAGANWHIQEQNNLDSGSVLFLVEQPEASRTGIIVIEPDTFDTSQTLINVTIHQGEVD
ncbi:MAG: hypothetical protein GTO18_00140 [Anaerolineales bacterium]|nr:hypothetical protein [Anaerolineales bacterium]